MSVLALVPLLSGCRVDDPSPPLVPVELSADDRVRRVSLAVRGIPPSENEIAQVEADPAALDGLVDGWLSSSEFAATLGDLTAETLWTRVDTEFDYPKVGRLAAVPQGQIMASFGEGPIKLVEDVVMSDLPYTDVLSVDYTMVDSVLAEMYGLPFDPEGPTWQRATWTDGRPAAGLLTDSGMWLRFRSSDTNYERERANTVSRVFLCTDFASADLPVLDDAAVVPPAGIGPFNDPACSGCHAEIDPLGSFFWGFRRYILPMEVRDAFDDGCPPGEAQFCYPFQTYDPATEDTWATLGMPAPGLSGKPGNNLADLGQLIVDDPRFAPCVARRFASYLAETRLEDVPSDAVDGWAAGFVAGGYDAKALVKAIVLDPGFSRTRPVDAEFVPGIQQLRPEQFARTLGALTGFWFRASETVDECATNNQFCWGEVDLLTTDRFGFRTLAGGISGYEVTDPTWSPTPTRTLVFERAAAEAAGYVVNRDFDAPPDRRELLLADPGTVAEPAVRAEIARLWFVLLGERVDPADPGVAAAWRLWSQVFDSRGAKDAWEAVIAGLLQHPRMEYY